MRLKILITNDDGYDHLGHLSLKKILKELRHEVWSIAPQENQSGVGMKLTLGKRLEFQELDSHSWACSGTPVDCVLFALHGILPFRPDAVISGINAGSNLSDDVWYSGTAAAAREACKWGLPALALSYSTAPPYHEQNFTIFGSLLEQHLKDLLQACELKDKATGQNFVGFLNINIPPHCNREVRFAKRFEQRPYQNVLQKTGKNQYMLCGNIDEQQQQSAGVDAAINAISQVSISLGAFHALQPLLYQLALPIMNDQSVSTEQGPLTLSPSEQASQAMSRIVQTGI